MLTANKHESFKKKPPAVVCLGYFDGVHLGHRSLIDTANRIKQELECLSCVHTYFSPPVKFVNPDIEYAELTRFPEKYELLKKCGADIVLTSNFDEAIMTMSGESFIKDIIMSEIELKHIVVGFDHKFGYRGTMGTEELRKLCKSIGVGLSVVEPVIIDGFIVSSTEIKRQISIANIALAEKMLGRSLDIETIKRIQCIK